jgi:type II secretory pathway component PulF
MSAILQAGATLSDALARFASIMPAEYLDLVLAGESAGHVPEVFQILSRRGRQTLDHRARLFAIAAYPLLLFWVVGSLTTLIFTIVVPRFRDIAESFGVTMPAWLFGLSLLWRVIILLGFGFIVSVMVVALPTSLVARSQGLMDLGDTVKWWLPLSRRYEKYQATRLFAQSLEIQLRGGVAFRDALQLACQAKVNWGARKRLETMREEIEGGTALSAAAARCGLFPSRFVHLLAMGETVGNMLPALEEIASGSTDACDRMVTWTMLVAVPTAVVTAGLAIATIGISMFRMFIEIMTTISGNPA